MIRKIKSALAAGIRPMSMIFHEQPTDPWKPMDFELIEAYQTLEDETCNVCGNPIWICRSEDNNVQFKIENTVCFADKEYQNWEKRKKKSKKDWEPDPGQQFYPVPFTINGEPLPGRDDYYRGLADRIG